MFTPPMSGSFTLTYSIADPCPMAIQATIVAIGAPSTQIISGQPGGCNLEPVVFAAQPAGGTWGGLAQPDGWVDQSCAVRPISGNATYTYHAPNGDCTEVAYGYLYLAACLNPLPMGPDTALCSNDEFMLSWTWMGGGNVYWSITGADSVITSSPGSTTTGYFSPYQKEPGIYAITGELSSSFPTSCPGIDTLLVTVLAPPVIIIGTHAPLCSNDSPITLSGSPVGGTWTGVGVSDDQFDPAIAGSGTWTLTYTVTEGACTSSDSTTIVVDAAPNAGIGGSVEVCATSAPINLFVYLQGTPQQGGVWSDQFGVTSGLFMPGISQEGTYTYTATGAGPCESATAQLEVNVMDLQLDPILAPDTETIPGTYIFTALPVLIDADSIVWSFPAAWSWDDDPDHTDGEALLMPSETGVYSVCATAYGGDGCIGIEQCFQVIVTDIAARGTTGQRMAIFPNPNNGQFTITMDGLPTIGRILVLDALGKVLQQHMIVGTSTMQIDLGDLASGMYHVRIETEREVVCLPLVVRR